MFNVRLRLAFNDAYKESSYTEMGKIANHQSLAFSLSGPPAVEGSIAVEDAG